jgi:hypothetical protein
MMRGSVMCDGFPSKFLQEDNSYRNTNKAL